MDAPLRAACAREVVLARFCRAPANLAMLAWATEPVAAARGEAPLEKSRLQRGPRNNGKQSSIRRDLRQHFPSNSASLTIPAYCMELYHIHRRCQVLGIRRRRARRERASKQNLPTGGFCWMGGLTVPAMEHLGTDGSAVAGGVQ